MKKFLWPLFAVLVLLFACYLYWNWITKRSEILPLADKYDDDCSVFEIKSGSDATGTGWVSDINEVTTAHHVVFTNPVRDFPNPIYIKIKGLWKRAAVKSTSPQTLSHLLFGPYTLIKQNGDFAVLSVSTENIRPLHYAKAPPAIKTKFRWYRYGCEEKFSGTLARIEHTVHIDFRIDKFTDDSTIIATEGEYLLFHEIIIPGSSGSPILNDRDEVVAS